MFLHLSNPLLWAEMSPQNSYIEALIPGTSECDYLEMRPFKEVTELKTKPLGWTLIQPDWGPFNRGNLDTETPGQSMPREKVMGGHSEKVAVSKPGGGLSPGTESASTLVLDFPSLP